MIGETLKALAEDVFSGDMEIQYNLDGHYRCYMRFESANYTEPQLELQRMFTDFEMAQLNDIASAMWEARAYPENYNRTHTPEWRIED